MGLPSSAILSNNKANIKQFLGSFTVDSMFKKLVDSHSKPCFAIEMI